MPPRNPVPKRGGVARGGKPREAGDAEAEEEQGRRMWDIRNSRPRPVDARRAIGAEDKFGGATRRGAFGFKDPRPVREGMEERRLDIQKAESLAGDRGE